MNMFQCLCCFSSFLQCNLTSILTLFLLFVTQTAKLQIAQQNVASTNPPDDMEAAEVAALKLRYAK